MFHAMKSQCNGGAVAGRQERGDQVATGSQWLHGPEGLRTGRHAHGETVAYHSAINSPSLSSERSRPSCFVCAVCLPCPIFVSPS